MANTIHSPVNKGYTSYFLLELAHNLRNQNRLYLDKDVKVTGISKYNLLKRISCFIKLWENTQIFLECYHKSQKLPDDFEHINYKDYLEIPNKIPIFRIPIQRMPYLYGSVPVRIEGITSRDIPKIPPYMIPIDFFIKTDRENSISMDLLENLEALNIDNIFKYNNKTRNMEVVKITKNHLTNFIETFKLDHLTYLLIKDYTNLVSQIDSGALLLFLSTISTEKELFEACIAEVILFHFEANRLSKIIKESFGFSSLDDRVDKGINKVLNSIKKLFNMGYQIQYKIQIYRNKNMYISEFVNLIESSKISLDPYQYKPIIKSMRKNDIYFDDFMFLHKISRDIMGITKYLSEKIFPLIYKDEVNLEEELEWLKDKNIFQDKFDDVLAEYIYDKKMREINFLVKDYHKYLDDLDNLKNKIFGYANNIIFLKELVLENFFENLNLNEDVYDQIRILDSDDYWINIKKISNSFFNTK